MNQKAFFAAVRRDLFNGRLTQGQVDGINRIVDYRRTNWPRMIDEELAYLLATVKWETGHSMQPVEEGYPRRGEALRSFQRGLRYYPWYGRGLVQITWERNYKLFGIERREDALTWPVALRTLFEGCIKGMFTGKKLADYISTNNRDYVNARRVVNGLDKAEKIARYAELFLSAIKRAKQVPDETPTTDNATAGGLIIAAGAGGANLSNGGGDTSSLLIAVAAFGIWMLINRFRAQPAGPPVIDIDDDDDDIIDAEPLQIEASEAAEFEAAKQAVEDTLLAHQKALSAFEAVKDRMQAEADEILARIREVSPRKAPSKAVVKADES